MRAHAHARLSTCALRMADASAPVPPAKRHHAAPSGTKRQHDANLLGDEMKRWEDETCSAVVDLSRPVVVRLDGHCFHTYTRGFRRPYDVRIHNAMVATATDLLERFGAATAFTESDEISLLFPPSTGESQSLPFNGRVQKIVSVTAGFASARFNMHMAAQHFDAPGRGGRSARSHHSDRSCSASRHRPLESRRLSLAQSARRAGSALRSLSLLAGC